VIEMRYQVEVGFDCAAPLCVLPVCTGVDV
jgi:hypothetical protein